MAAGFITKTLSTLLSSSARWVEWADGRSSPSHASVMVDPTTGLPVDLSAAVPVSLKDDVVYGPTSLTAVSQMLEVDTTGYNSIIVEVSQNNGSQVQFETTEDGSFVTVYPMKSNDPLAVAASVVTGTSTRYGAKTQRYFRAKLLTYANATPVIVKIRLSNRVPLDAVRGDVIAYLNPRVDAGLLSSRIKGDAASGFIKATRGQLYGYDLLNTNAAIRYLQIFAKTSAPNLGADAALLVYTIPIPAGQRAAISVPHGVLVSTGLSYAVTTDAVGATIGAAGDIVGTVSYL